MKKIPPLVGRSNHYSAAASADIGVSHARKVSPPGLSGVFTLCGNDPLAANIVLNLRLPRVLTALILGGTLAMAGLVFQTVLGNPLVEPGFLGVSQGAAFGAALVIVLNVKAPLAVPLSAGVFALAALAMTWFHC